MFWVLVAVVAWANGGHLTRQGHRPETIRS
jgi:hypothetical protein